LSFFTLNQGTHKLKSTKIKLCIQKKHTPRHHTMRPRIYHKFYRATSCYDSFIDLQQSSDNIQGSVRPPTLCFPY
jgi:hypothetical protein